MFKRIIQCVELYRFIKRTEGRIFSATAKNGRKFNLKTLKTPKFPRLSYRIYDNNLKREVSIPVGNLVELRCKYTKDTWSLLDA